jgi:hypothetical protein
MAQSPILQTIESKVVKAFVFIDKGIRRALVVGDIVHIPARIFPGLKDGGYLAPPDEPAAAPATEAKTKPPR